MSDDFQSDYSIASPVALPNLRILATTAGVVVLTREQGLNFFPLVPASSETKPIFITEYCNNIGSDSDHDKGMQYCDWAAYIQANYPTVTRAYLYIISSNTLAENETRQTIVRNNVVSAIATGIKDGNINPAPVSREFDHWQDMDTGANLGTTNPLSFVISSNRNIRAITRSKAVISYTCQVSTDGFGSATGGGTYETGSTVTVRWNA